MDNTQLPAEVEAEIEAYADEITKPLKMDNEYQVGYNNGMEAGAISAGTHFAEKLYQAQQEIEKAKLLLAEVHKAWGKMTLSYGLINEIKTFLDGTK